MRNGFQRAFSALRHCIWSFWWNSTPAGTANNGLWRVRFKLAHPKLRVTDRISGKVHSSSMSVQSLISVNKHTDWSICMCNHNQCYPLIPLIDGRIWNEISHISAVNGHSFFQVKVISNSLAWNFIYMMMFLLFFRTHRHVTGVLHLRISWSVWLDRKFNVDGLG